MIPLRVIRGAPVNALMHRSYRSHSLVQTIRYANRLEIRNPGFSLKSPEHLGEPGSQPRNPKIAAVLHETRFAETKGSGIRVMRESMAQAGLTPPLFESDRGADQFVARYFFHHFLGEEDIAWLAQFRDLHLSGEEAHCPGPILGTRQIQYITEPALTPRPSPARGKGGRAPGQQDLFGQDP